jgi:hypothetical protein
MRQCVPSYEVISHLGLAQSQAVSREEVGRRVRVVVPLVLLVHAMDGHIILEASSLCGLYYTWRWLVRDSGSLGPSLLTPECLSKAKETTGSRLLPSSQTGLSPSMEFKDAAVQTEEMAMSVDGENDEFRGSGTRSRLITTLGSELTGNSCIRGGLVSSSFRPASHSFMAKRPKPGCVLDCSRAPAPESLRLAGRIPLYFFSSNTGTPEARSFSMKEELLCENPGWWTTVQLVRVRDN